MNDAPTPEDVTTGPRPPGEESAEVAEVIIEYVVPEGAYGSVFADDGLAGLAEPPILAEVAPAPMPTPESPAAVEAIRALGESLGKRLDALQSLFEREGRAEATRERVVDRLHAELQEYKQDLLLKVLRPVFVDLIQLHDDIGKMVAAGADDAKDDDRAARLLGTMGGFQQGIEDILYRQGVEPFAVEADAFDPRLQRAVSTVPTEDGALNKTVAARLRKGFKAGEKVIRPEVVAVYAAKKRD